MDLQEILPQLEKNYFIFEQDGRVRQPVLRFFSVRAYNHTNPGVALEHYLHRDGSHGRLAFSRVSTTFTASFSEGFLGYRPIERIELLDGRPHIMEWFPWEVLLVKVYQGADLVKGKPAMLRLLPKKEHFTLTSREGRLCRFQDEDGNGKWQPVWGNGFHSYLDAAE